MRSSVAAVDAVDTAPPGSSSGQSSSGGSGSSSPQREEDTTLETEIVPLAELPGQPEQAELDLWNSLMTLDGARAAFFRRARSFFRKQAPPAFARASLFLPRRPSPAHAKHSSRSLPSSSKPTAAPASAEDVASPSMIMRNNPACNSPESWAQQLGQPTTLPPTPGAQQLGQPITPLKPLSDRKSAAKGFKAEGATTAAAAKPATTKARAATSKSAAAKQSSPLVPKAARAAASAAVAAAAQAQQQLVRPAATLASAAASAPSAEDPTQMLLGPGRLDMSAIDAELAMKSAAAAAGAGLLGLDDEDAPENETAEEKRLRRMRRNRESAAMSRNRKKQYVEELEAQVAQLHEITRTLKSENFELRRECARMGGGANILPTIIPGGPDAVGPEGYGSLEDGFSALAPEDLILAEPTPPTTTAVPAAASSIVVADPAVAAAGVKRSGSPLLGGGAKRASAGTLAFMSAVTLVTYASLGTTTQRNPAADFDDLSSMRNPRGHSPTARMLMSITEAALPWSRPVAPQVLPEHHETRGLWPSLGLGGSRNADSVVGAPPTSTPPATTWELPAPEAATTVEPPRPIIPGPSPVPRGYAERVIRAPQNSSWADVLRIEAAEKQLAEAQLALRNLRAASQSAEATALARLGEHAPATPNEAVAPYHAGHAASPTATHHVFEQTPLEEEDLDAAEYDAQRFIFCSRAYMFDAAVRRPTAPSLVEELNLPKAMPARFQHAAAYRHQQAQQQAAKAQLPQLSDGGNATPSADSNRPVVTLLLPSAALQGVVEEKPKTQVDNNELMQVQCQVLNASRFTPAVPGA